MRYDLWNGIVCCSFVFIEISILFDFFLRSLTLHSLPTERTTFEWIHLKLENRSLVSVLRVAVLFPSGWNVNRYVIFAFICCPPSTIDASRSLFFVAPKPILCVYDYVPCWMEIHSLDVICQNSQRLHFPSEWHFCLVDTNSNRWLGLVHRLRIPYEQTMAGERMACHI